MQAATPPRLPDEPRSAPHPTPDAARARYSRAPTAGRLTLRTTACGLFDSCRTAHPPHLAVGGPHAVVPNLVSTPPTPLALRCRPRVSMATRQSPHPLAARCLGLRDLRFPSGCARLPHGRRAGIQRGA